MSTSRQVANPPEIFEIQPNTKSEAIPETGPLQVTVQDAVFMALENNRSLGVEQQNPFIQKTFEDQERALFDPVMEAELSAEKERSERPIRSGGDYETSKSDVYQSGIFLKQFFPTGTFVNAEFTGETEDSSLYDEPFSTSRMGVSVIQSLGRGYGVAVNLAGLRQAEIETDISRYELRGFCQNLVAQVEMAYWDYALANRQIEIVEESLKLTRQQLTETESMIQVGTLAESELAAVQAELATEQQELINADSALSSSRLRLLRLINPPGQNIWDREVTLIYDPKLPVVSLDDIQTHIAASLRNRPEINQAKLDIQQEDIEVVYTRNGLLPRMDVFITMGKSGYADSFPEASGKIVKDSYDLSTGVLLEYPFFNREAKAKHRRARMRRNQSQNALANLEQLVELDVQTAYIEVNRTKQQIAASQATRAFQEEKFRIETEKFRVGRTNSFSVAQAQRDLLASRINEVQSLINYLKSLIDFYRFEGSLLDRRGIFSPADSNRAQQSMNE